MESLEFSGCYFKLARYFWPVNECTSHVSRKSVSLGMIMPFPSAGNGSSPAYQHKKKDNIKVSWIISTSRNHLEFWASKWSWRHWAGYPDLCLWWGGTWLKQAACTIREIFRKICLCPAGRGRLCASGREKAGEVTRWGNQDLFNLGVEREKKNQN